ncbi:MAG: tRNA (cytidine(34)-2'-O)-methyltransferase [Rhodospirillaceae bacterium]|nr:tRNA (cytidine(34)-2'-O)-methyltransferase [Rhodospirillaceae bacterium]MCY4238482.1 tRNA (cytidine(34)-2'-O)-methyltransferase [Rhodospirillaceae bacterium]MCY4309732.1 tRNA (cytidine(34)-2'-O)-methyltransferase [Rhodospirillaceae bacterium]
MRLVLFQPDIPQNVGAAIRLGACLGVGIDIVEPCGFVLDGRRLRRAAMDYADIASVVRHRAWDAFLDANDCRLVLLSTKGTVRLPDFSFEADDRFILGRESGGVPETVVRRADAVVRVPMIAAARSLNVVTTGAIVLAEALRQTNGWSAD